jgi:purine nucleoside permease
MAVDLNALVLPAFEDLEGLPGEVTPWRAAYALDRTVRIEGVPSPLRYTDGGLGVVPTGVGKSAAATTTTALCASDAVDLDDALVLSVGAAGGPPQLSVGSVVLADCIVDWDDSAGLTRPIAFRSR